MTLLRVTAPQVTAISLVEAKAHLREDADDENDLITGLIEAVEAAIGPDSAYGIALAEQHWKLLRPDFPSCGGGIELRVSQVTAIDSVVYVDQDGTETTLAGTEYKLQRGGRGASVLYPAYGKYWPSFRCQPEAVQITFTCGYEPGSSSPTDYAENIPASIKAAIKMAVAEMHKNRGITAAEAVNRLPNFDWLLDQYRVF
jgi:uncharacterized phiE125 gp8 family phage protein